MVLNIRTNYAFGSIVIQIFTAIDKMANPDVTVNLEKLQTNIVLVKLNNSKINPKDFLQRLMKVNTSNK